MFNLKKLLLTSALLLPLTACTLDGTSSEVREDREPEAATGIEQKALHTAQKFMVAAANPYASQAGYNVLEKGGSAIDAAIAVQLVLTLVEPQSSGIGGGAFILHFDNQAQKLTSFDGRETAPAKSSQDMFLQKNGQPVRWIDAVVGGRSVGVPGVLKALEDAHNKYGTLPWAALFEDAITLAEEGFIVSPRMAKLVAMGFNPGIKKLSNASNYFYPNGQPLAQGSLLKNPQLGKVYRAIAEQGTEVFYRGWIAENIVAAVNNAAIAPGTLSMVDMKKYQAQQKSAVCAPYKAYKLCGMAPPSSGGVAVIQILKQLEQHNLAQVDPMSEKAVHLFAQSSRLAFADRNHYIADPDFIDVPVEQLITDNYTARRGELIEQQDLGKVSHGRFDPMVRAADNAIEMPSTSHISIVDAKGNAISMTTSIEMAFGSALMVDGFLLNNQLTDFSLAPEVDGKPVANALAPLKRPRSSMAPMMVFNADNSLRLVVGSPGGSRIINYVAQTMIAVLDWDMDIQSAIDLPKVTNRNDVTSLEKGTELEALQGGLEQRGHKVSIRNLNSGIQGIEVFDSQLVGGADPRREGKVMGQ
ncbi:gamma-glutamyltransferase [Thalassotalea sp. Y01]|uniref:gamma-glutamyltransferase n=1 Tax=Thalassotalea sp. Y01 TaxID=2729613 RepID=UPI0032B7B8D0